jgi:hypothetical protein
MSWLSTSGFMVEAQNVVAHAGGVILCAASTEASCSGVVPILSSDVGSSS